MKPVEAFEVAARTIGLYLFVESFLQGADRIPFFFLQETQYGTNVVAGNAALIIALTGLAAFGLAQLFYGRRIATFVYERMNK